MDRPAAQGLARKTIHMLTKATVSTAPTIHASHSHRPSWAVTSCASATAGIPAKSRPIGTPSGRKRSTLWDFSVVSRWVSQPSSVPSPPACWFTRRASPAM